jgi:hypothetical protein
MYYAKKWTLRIELVNGKKNICYCIFKVYLVTGTKNADISQEGTFLISKIFFISPLGQGGLFFWTHIGPCHVSGIFLPLRVKSLPLATIYEVKIPLRKWKKSLLQRNPAQMTSAIVSQVAWQCVGFTPRAGAG